MNQNGHRIFEITQNGEPYVCIRDWDRYGYTLAAFMDGEWKPFLHEKVNFYMPFIGTPNGNLRFACKRFIESLLKE